MRSSEEVAKSARFQEYFQRVSSSSLAKTIEFFTKHWDEFDSNKVKQLQQRWKKWVFKLQLIDSAVASRKLLKPLLLLVLPALVQQQQPSGGQPQPVPSVLRQSCVDYYRSEFAAGAGSSDDDDEDKTMAVLYDQLQHVTGHLVVLHKLFSSVSDRVKFKVDSIKASSSAASLSLIKDHHHQHH